MAGKIYNVLFLCTGNSARSIMAESILNRLGHERFRSYSAGSAPIGRLHPGTADLLHGLDYDLSLARSKSWSEFALPGAPVMDFIFTVCDKAHGEVCPIWPGHPVTCHWGVPDPASIDAEGIEAAERIGGIYRTLHQRIEIFAELRIEVLDQLSLKTRLDQIGAAA